MGYNPLPTLPEAAHSSLSRGIMVDEVTFSEDDDPRNGRDEPMSDLQRLTVRLHKMILGKLTTTAALRFESANGLVTRAVLRELARLGQLTLTQVRALEMEAELTGKEHRRGGEPK